MVIKVIVILTSFLLFIRVIFSPSLAFAGNPPDEANSTLTATEVPADGSTQSTITVTLKDSGGIPLAGDIVQLRNTTDPNISLSPANATLDASGSAIFTATSTKEGTDPIDVIDTSTGNTINQLGQIIFDPFSSGSTNTTDTSSTDPGCQSTQPADAPNLYQVIGVNKSATLYFAPPSSAYTGFTISYGLDAKADAYNATIQQNSSSGAVQYTINDLTPNTKYYFQVRADNGCAPGPWSKVLNTTGAKAPVTGPMDGVLLMAGACALLLGGMGVFFKFR